MNRFKLTCDAKGKYRFALIQGAKKVLADSEAYESKASAENGIESVRKNAVEEDHYQINPETSGGSGFYVSLKAGNHQVIAHSRSHVTEDAARKAIQAIMSIAPGAKLDDQC